MTLKELRDKLEAAGVKLVNASSSLLSVEKRFLDQLEPQWHPISEIPDKYDGSYLLHGPGLVHGDFNREGVERGYWQDGAWPGTMCSTGAPYVQETGEKEPEGSGPGAWCVPGWDSNGDVFYTRFVGDKGITHFAKVPRGPHSEKEPEDFMHSLGAGTGMSFVKPSDMGRFLKTVAPKKGD